MVILVKKNILDLAFSQFVVIFPMNHIVFILIKQMMSINHYFLLTLCHKKVSGLCIWIYQSFHGGHGKTNLGAQAIH